MNFPQDFTARIRSWREDYAELEEALQADAPVSIRRNPAKTVAQHGRERVRWCTTGYYLSGRPAFTFDPLLHAGAYYVQEAASMFLEQAVRQYAAPGVWLDLCAAPGGKSTHLLSLLPAQSLLVCNEVIGHRAAVLAENTLKWGVPNVAVMNSDPAEAGRLTHVFDLIVADLPCSGEGMFRREPASRAGWSAANAALCAARQRRIVYDVWPALKPGGICIYSTCTFNREENEDNIRHLAAHLPADVLPVAVEDDWHVCCNTADRYPSCRFFPHLTKGEGFFLAVLRKPDGALRPFSFRTKGRPAAALPPQAAGWLAGGGDCRLLTAPAGAPACAVPERFAELCAGLSGQMRMLTAGVPLGGWKGTDFLPAPALALNTTFRCDAFPAVDLAWTDAVRYLQREAPALPPDTPKGYLTVTFRNMPLGFVKNIGRRANNLWPPEWRIRSRHLPEQEPRIL